MILPAFIHWNADPVLVEIGSFGLRWYGLLFGTSFLAGYVILYRIFKKEGLQSEILDKLTLYVAVGTFAGARLGHCFFYEPEKYLANPIDIFKIWEGGLASHGAAIGIIISLYLFSRYVLKRNMLWGLDRVVIVVALSGLFIRTGNLINSEIIGNATDKSWGFVFQGPHGGDQYYPEMFAEYTDQGAKVTIAPEGATGGYPFILYALDPEQANPRLVESFNYSGGKLGQTILDQKAAKMPIKYVLKDGESGREVMYITLQARHPAQLYEAFLYLLIFFFLLWYYYRMDGKVPYGRLFGLFLMMLFTVRFFVEFTKEEQVDFEEGMALNMGQILSIPLVLAGVFFVANSFRKPKTEG